MSIPRESTSSAAPRPAAADASRPATGASPGSPPESPRPAALLRHSLLLAGRSLAKTARNPGLLANGVMTPVIFLVLFVYLFGGAVAGSQAEYLQYVFPGILVTGAGLSGMMSSGMALNADVKKGVFDRFRSLPIGRTAPLLGSVMADVVRYAVAVAVLFAIGFLMGFRIQTDAAQALAAAALAILFGFCISWVTVFLGVLLRDEGTLMMFIFLAFVVLLFGTDLAAPLETLPGWLRAWAEVNPVTHAMGAARGLLSGYPLGDSVTWTLLWSGVVFAVFCPLSVLVYARER
jgi:oleandomycin transport system permease protein